MPVEEPTENVEFRWLTVTDAAAFADFVPLLDVQSEFMLYEPRERGDFGIEESRAKIAAETRHGLLVGAFASAQHLVGYVSAQGSALPRIRHVLYLVLGVLPAYGHHGNWHRIAWRGREMGTGAWHLPPGIDRGAQERARYWSA